MSRRLQSFVEEHPEFFEEKNGYWRLSADISGLMERYARAYNKEEFDRMRALVEEAKQKERERLRAEIEKWSSQCAEENQKVRQIESQLKGLDNRVRVSEKVLAEVEEARRPKPVEKRSWYHSGAVFVLLALLGVSFLYLGIIINERTSMSYVFAGISCFVMGLYLQSVTPKAQVAPVSVGTPYDDIVREETGAIKISRIKRATLMERKRVANQSVAAFNRKINSSLAKLETLDG